MKATILYVEAYPLIRTNTQDGLKHKGYSVKSGDFLKAKRAVRRGLEGIDIILAALPGRQGKPTEDSARDFFAKLAGISHPPVIIEEYRHEGFDVPKLEAQLKDAHFVNSGLSSAVDIYDSKIQEVLKQTA